MLCVFDFSLSLGQNTVGTDGNNVMWHFCVPVFLRMWTLRVG